MWEKLLKNYNWDWIFFLIQEYLIIIKRKGAKTQRILKVFPFQDFIFFFTN